MKLWELKKISPKTIKIKRPFCRETTQSNFKEHDYKEVARGSLDSHESAHVLNFIELHTKKGSVKIFFGSTNSHVSFSYFCLCTFFIVESTS